MIRKQLATAAMIIAGLVLLALVFTEWITPQSRMPDWVTVQDGPVVHSAYQDVFYRSVVFKGNARIMGDLRIDGGTTGSSTTITVTYGLAIPVSTDHVKLISSAAITNATVTSGTLAGQQLILTGINVSGTITVTEGTNTWGGDLGFTDQAQDAASMIWDGSRWVLMSWHDN